MRRPYVVAVTGGIGSGKTTVCDLFAERHDVPVVDTDLIAREVVEPGTPGLRDIVAAFGTGILGADGRLDRPALKRIVFADDARREELERILHPLIRERMEARIRELTAPYCLVCIPLLAEGGKHDLIDRVLVVDCDERTQVERVSARDDLTPQEVLAIMRTQAGREARKALADDVLVNEGDPSSIAARVDALHAKYQALSAGRARR